MTPTHGWSPERARDVLDQITGPGPVLMALQALQEEFGYVPAEAVPFVAEVYNVSRADVYGVLTFYRDLRQTPPPAIQVEVCMGEACQSVGSRDLRRAAHEVIGDDGEVRDVFCVGNCALGPAATVNGRLIGRATRDALASCLDGEGASS